MRYEAAALGNYAAIGKPVFGSDFVLACGARFRANLGTRRNAIKSMILLKLTHVTAG
jgi:hypothetical protein